MINPQELRLGNWVKIREQYYVQVMDFIGLEWFSYKQGQACNYEDAEPIPLTPTILEKLGFWIDGKYNSANRWVSKLSIILFEGNGYFIFLHYPLTEIKYVHELQNLTYSITKKELPIDSIN